MKRFGLTMHVGRDGKSSKTEALYIPCPRRPTQIVTTTCSSYCQASHLAVGDMFSDSGSIFRVTAVPDDVTVRAMRISDGAETEWNYHPGYRLGKHWQCEFKGCNFSDEDKQTVADHESFCLRRPTLLRYHEPLDIAALTQPFDVDDDGGYVTFCEEFRYLGSVIATDAADAADIKSRVASATRAFGALRACLFANKDISFKAKKMAYEALVLSILLYGSECWVPLEETLNRTRTFHRTCVRAICNVTLHHQRVYRINMQKLLDRCGINTFREYVDSRQLGWLGHVARMDPSRLPRRFLTAWVNHPRPIGGVNKTYGHRLIGCCGIIKRRLPHRAESEDVDNTAHPWLDQAQDRNAWRASVRKGCNMKPPKPTRRSQPRSQPQQGPHLPQYQPPPPQPPQSPRIRFNGRPVGFDGDRFTSLQHRIFYEPWRTITNQGNQIWPGAFDDWFFHVSVSNWNAIIAAHPDRAEADEFDLNA